MIAVLATILALPSAQSLHGTCTRLNNAESAEADLNNWQKPLVWVSEDAVESGTECNAADRDALRALVAKNTKKREAFDRIESVHKAFCTKVSSVMYKIDYLEKFCDKPWTFAKIDYLARMNSTRADLKAKREAEGEAINNREKVELARPESHSPQKEWDDYRKEEKRVNHVNKLKAQIGDFEALTMASDYMRLLLDEVCLFQKYDWKGRAHALFSSVQCQGPYSTAKLNQCKHGGGLEYMTDDWYGYCIYTNDEYKKARDAHLDDDIAKGHVKNLNQSCRHEVPKLIKDESIKIDKLKMERLEKDCARVKASEVAQLRARFDRQQAEELKKKNREICRSFLVRVTNDFSDASACKEHKEFRAELLELAKEKCAVVDACIKVPDWLEVSLREGKIVNRKVDHKTTSAEANERKSDVGSEGTGATGTKENASRITVTNGLITGAGILGAGYLIHDHVNKASPPSKEVGTISETDYTVIIVLCAILAVVVIIDIVLYVA